MKRITRRQALVGAGAAIMAGPGLMPRRAAAAREVTVWWTQGFYKAENDAVIAWMAGLLYLPRLFAYHTRATPGSEMAAPFETMEVKLYRIIMNPARPVKLTRNPSRAPRLVPSRRYTEPMNSTTPATTTRWPAGSGACSRAPSSAPSVRIPASARRRD